MCGWAGGRREVGRGDARPLQQSDSNNRDWDSRLRHSRLRQMTDSDSRLRQTTDSENRLDQSSIRRLGWPPEVSESAHLGWAHGPARTHRLGFRSRPWPGSGPLPRRRSLLLRTRPPFPPFPPARPAASRPGRGRREDAGGSMLLRRRLGAWRCRQRLWRVHPSRLSESPDGAADPRLVTAAYGARVWRGRLRAARRVRDRGGWALRDYLEYSFSSSVSFTTHGTGVAGLCATARVSMGERRPFMGAALCGRRRGVA